MWEDKVKEIFRENSGIDENININRAHRVSAKNDKRNEENANNKNPITVVLIKAY